MNGSDDTRQQLLYAALALFAKQGIKRTTMDDIAACAGVTRVTVYRYYSSKQALVRAAFLTVVTVFQHVLHDLEEGSLSDIETALNAIETGLAALPRGNYQAQLAELQILYPSLFAEIEEARITVMQQLFTRLADIGARQDVLREGLNPAIVQYFFFEMIVNQVSNPRVAALNLSPEEVYANLKAIFLHGIMK